jgi:hypothetical protein
MKVLKKSGRELVYLGWTTEQWAIAKPIYVAAGNPEPAETAAGALMIKQWWNFNRSFDPGCSPIVTDLKPLPPDHWWVANTLCKVQGACPVDEDQLEDA